LDIATRFSNLIIVNLLTFWFIYFTYRPRRSLNRIETFLIDVTPFNLTLYRIYCSANTKLKGLWISPSLPYPSFFHSIGQFWLTGQLVSAVGRTGGRAGGVHSTHAQHDRASEWVRTYDWCLKTHSVWGWCRRPPTVHGPVTTHPPTPFYMSRCRWSTAAVKETRRRKMHSASAAARREHCVWTLSAVDDGVAGSGDTAPTKTLRYATPMTPRFNA